jgi:hypothetical protein
LKGAVEKMKMFVRFTTLALVLAAALVAGFSGIAWAADDVDDIVSLIKNWAPEGVIAARSGNTITVTGNATQNVTSNLSIDTRDFNDVVVDINWEADVDGENVDMLIALRGNTPKSGNPTYGNFTVKAGAEITGGHETLLSLGGFNIVVEGGATVKSVVDNTIAGLESKQEKAIASEGNDRDNMGYPVGGNITIKKGAIVTAEHGTAIHIESTGRNLTLEDGAESGITGVVSFDEDSTLNGEHPTGYEEGGAAWDGHVYGNVTIKPGFDTMPYDEDDGICHLFIQPDATLKMKSDLIVAPGNSLWISGTLILDPDPGVLDNFGNVTVNSKGQIINKYRIVNEESGVITNRGKIENEAAIINYGKIYSDQDIKNVEGNPIIPLNDNKSGSGGCSAGAAGLLSLFLGGAFFLMRKRCG